MTISYKRLIERILKWIIIIGVVSGVVALALMSLKYFKKINPVGTSTISNIVEGVNIVAVASVFGTVFILMLVVVLILNNRIKNLKTNISREKKEKVSYGKISNWMGNWMGWFIVIVIISGVFVFVFVAPKYFKKDRDGKEKSVTIYAISEWKKKPEQSGTNPEKRRSGPMETIITRKTGGVFNFEIYYKDRNGNNRLAKFEGEYNSGDNISKTMKITGTWRQDYPEDYGDWFLKSTDADRFFEGWFTGRTGEEIPFFLKIKK